MDPSTSTPANSGHADDPLPAISLQRTVTNQRDSSPNRLGLNLTREPSIRIRRLSAPTVFRPPPPMQDELDGATNSESRRPQLTLNVPGPDVSRQRTTNSIMPALAEEGGLQHLHPAPSAPPQSVHIDEPATNRTRRRGLSLAARSAFGRQRDSAQSVSYAPGSQYGSNAVDLLDVIGT